MNSIQKTLIQTSFAQVHSIAKTAAAMFYRRLFELDPTLITLFKVDLKEQGRKLMEVLEVIVNGIDRPDYKEALLPVLDALGERHVHYGVEERDYETVGVAL